MEIRTLRDIYSTFSGRVIYRGAEEYIQSQDAERFLDHVILADKKQFGIDGVVINEDGSIVSPLDMILDISDAPDSFDEARDFIQRNQGKATHFTFVINEN